MAINYADSAKQIVELIGGDSNVISVTHCATRLRFVLKEMGRVDKEVLKRVQGVITVIESSGQLQVVIGNHVGDAYREVQKRVQIDENAVVNAPKVGMVNHLMDIISSIFAPFLYPLAACGVLQGLISFFAAIGWMDSASGTFRILNFVSWTGFTFLPVMVAFTAAKKFNVNPFTAVIAACALVSPDYMNMLTANKIILANSADPVVQALMQSAMENPAINEAIVNLVGVPLNSAPLSFLGLPVQYLSYTASVIPIILMVWAMSYVQRFFERILPVVVRNLFTPMFCLAIMVPLTLLAFGPIGNLIGGAIGGIYNTLYHLSPSIAGAVFGVYFKAKDPELKSVTLSAGVTALFGITEPAIYGVALRFKRPLICGCLAGAIGGTVAGAFNAVSWSYCIPGIAVLPVFFKEGHMAQFLGFLLSIGVAFTLGVIFSWMAGFQTDAEISQPQPLTSKAV
ncbi:PTS transporter subunit EIIC [Aeromonas caviae]|uniref:PTS transporter subunit EIIC n=1 Tax=Aeromonas caviae TaxID=648 RepID=UPI0029D60A4D|nr:PTS transporter subunit EIIC [Aeromonas caviae]MDX7717927.1 PTS transporter subunit EIIC [Aeromonas caviae]